MESKAGSKLLFIVRLYRKTASHFSGTHSSMGATIPKSLCHNKEDIRAIWLSRGALKPDALPVAPRCRAEGNITKEPADRRVGDVNQSACACDEACGQPCGYEVPNAGEDQCDLHRHLFFGRKRRFRMIRNAMGGGSRARREASENPGQANDEMHRCRHNCGHQHPSYEQSLGPGRLRSPSSRALPN